MRALLFILSAVLVAAATARADDVTDLRDRVLKAHATDPADLKKFRVHTLKATGLSKLAKDPVPSTWHLVAVWPGDMRLTWEWVAGGKQGSVTVAFSGDRGWQAASGSRAEDLPIDALNDVRADGYALWVATLMTLKDAESKLAVARPGKVNGEPVVGLTVSRRSWPDINLYFDEKTGLLRKMAYRSREAGVFLNKEIVFAGYKDVDGLRLPTRQTTILDGREVAEWTAMEYAFPERIDPKTFQKP